ncbi:MAG TPA: HlyD family efflux transporter periplasmic adaptor subunit [Candidatus Sulfotelmatobacter sp.]|nr:HlyD family efflux transporter periplasmic adaptor subunit [Candidatus Sulfotelmatobacter sp.]
MSTHLSTSARVSHRRRNLVIVVGALVLLIAIAVLARPRHGGRTVETVTLAPSSFEVKLPETGVVQRPRTDVLAALVAGNLERIAVKPGQHVAAGTLLASIANPQLVNAEQDAHDAYLSALGHARSTSSTSAALPAQNRSAVVQAEANLEQARFNLSQAVQDARSGTQSGLGYGGQSAAAQRAQADAQVENALTDLREQQRLADADRDLYAQKALSKDALDQQSAKAAEAQVTYNQQKSLRDETYAQLARQTPVLSDRVRAARDAVTQAQAALSAAQADAAEDKSGDVQAADADAAQRLADWRYAADQVARLRIVAPFAGTVQSVATESNDTLRPLQTGDPVTVGQAIVTLAGDEGFIVRARVDEQDIAGVRLGQLALISGEDLGTTTLPGHVATIGAVAQKSDDPANTARQIVTTIALDRTTPYLRDGMSVDVDIVTDRRAHALVVPNSALRHDAGGATYVLVVRGGTAQRRSVRVGPTNDVATVLLAGVRAGDVVVTSPDTTIVAGLAVVPTSAPKASPSPKP